MTIDPCLSCRGPTFAVLPAIRDVAGTLLPMQHHHAMRVERPRSREAFEPSHSKIWVNLNLLASSQTPINLPFHGCCCFTDIAWCSTLTNRCSRPNFGNEAVCDHQSGPYCFSPRIFVAVHLNAPFRNIVIIVSSAASHMPSQNKVSRTLLLRHQRLPMPEDIRRPATEMIRVVSDRLTKRIHVGYTLARRSISAVAWHPWDLTDVKQPKKAAAAPKMQVI